MASHPFFRVGFAVLMPRALPISLYVLIFLWFRNLWGVILANVSMVRIFPCEMLVKYFSRVANDGSSSFSQHCCVSSFASSRFCGATAATLVVAFAMLAAFAFVHSATTCGHSDPVGGGCFQSGRAATLAALLVTSFVFVLLWSIGQDLAGVLNCIGLDVLVVSAHQWEASGVQMVTSLSSAAAAAARSQLHHASAASVRLSVTRPFQKVSSAF